MVKGNNQGSGSKGNGDNDRRGRSQGSKGRPSRPTRSASEEDASSESSEGTDNPLHEVFLEEVADVHNAEQQLIKALPKMAKAAQSEELRAAFEAHLEETLSQVDRLKEAMESIGETLKSKKCKAMEGLLAEGKEMMEEHKGEPTIDAVLIAAAQKVEHYEIASYGTLVAWANELGHEEAAELLAETLEEEKAADEKLTQIAESTANAGAESGEKE
jgi:ferritin-like metal-binding protein YciE